MTELLPVQMFAESELGPEALKAIDVIAATLVQAEAAPESEARTPAYVLVCALKSNNLLVVDGFKFDHMYRQNAEMLRVLGLPLTSVRAEVVQLRKEREAANEQIHDFQVQLHAAQLTLEGMGDENESLRSQVKTLTKERDAIKAELEIALDDLRMERFPIDER